MGSESSGDAFAAAAGGSSSDGEEPQADQGAVQLGNVVQSRHEAQARAAAPQGPHGAHGQQVREAMHAWELPEGRRTSRRRRQMPCRQLQPSSPPASPSLEAGPILHCNLSPSTNTHYWIVTHCLQARPFEFSGKKRQPAGDARRPLLLLDINGVLMQHRWDGFNHHVRACGVLRAPRMSLWEVPFSADGA